MPKPANPPYNLKWIYAQTKGVRRYLVLLLVGGIFSAGANMGMTAILQQFVAIATGESSASLGQSILIAVGIFLVEGSMGLLLSVTFRVSANKTAKKMRLDMANRLYHSSLLDVQRHTVGGLMTNVTADVEKVSSCLPSAVRNTVGNALTAVLAIVYLFWLNWKMALLLLICIPLLIFCIAVFSPIVQKAGKADTDREESVRVYFQDVLEKLAIFKTCAMSKKILEKTGGLLDKKVRSARRLGYAEGGSFFLNNAMGTAVFTIALGGGAFFVARGELEVSAMIAVVQLSNYIIWPFTALGSIVSEINQAIASAQRLDRIYALPQEEDPAPARKKEVESLAIENLSFGYGDTSIIQSLNQTFSGKGIVGIIGESGCGKSTLLKVLAGLYPPKEGEVSLTAAGGEKITDLRPYIGLVPASDLVIADTLGANIVMAAPKDEEKLRRCAAMANIGEYIESLPEGYETLIGDGNALSSGQAQRVAIARALYQDAEILFFDEPTANLDAESIEIFLQTLDQISGGRLCMVVTHDPRVIERCQQTVEMKEGQLAG